MIANRWEPIAIRHRGKFHDRVFLVGAAGSGKTRLLSKRLIPAFANYPVILDPKGDFPEIRGIPVTNHYVKGRAQRIHIPRRQQSPEAWEKIIDQVLDRGNHTLVIDDIYAVNGGNPNPRPNLLWAISGGRGIGVPVWVGCQRPAKLPISVRSESEHYFIFPLRHEEDVKAVAADTDPRVRLWTPRLREHDVMYFKAVPPRRLVVLRGEVL